MGFVLSGDSTGLFVPGPGGWKVTPPVHSLVFYSLLNILSIRHHQLITPSRTSWQTCMLSIFSLLCYACSICLWFLLTGMYSNPFVSHFLSVSLPLPLLVQGLFWHFRCLYPPQAQPSAADPNHTALSSRHRPMLLSSKATFIEWKRIVTTTNTAVSH